MICSSAGTRGRFASSGIVALAVLTSCGPAQGSSDVSLARLGDPDVSHEVISGSLSADADVDAIIQPYREEYEAWAVEVVGQAAGAFTRGDPEATLNNMVADALLESARKLSSRPVDMAMLNDGGLRTDINEGPVYVSEVFEVMPFENAVSVIDLTGYQVDSLAHQIAVTRGEPVAGIRFRISSQPARAFDIEVGGDALDLNRTYRLALADYLADGGGGWPQLWTPVGREDFSHLIRDAIMDYVRGRSQIVPQLDGRISEGTP